MRLKRKLLKCSPACLRQCQHLLKKINSPNLDVGQKEERENDRHKFMAKLLYVGSCLLK